MGIVGHKPITSIKREFQLAMWSKEDKNLPVSIDATEQRASVFHLLPYNWHMCLNSSLTESSTLYDDTERKFDNKPAEKRGQICLCW